MHNIYSQYWYNNIVSLFVPKIKSFCKDWTNEVTQTVLPAAGVYDPAC